MAGSGNPQQTTQPVAGGAQQPTQPGVFGQSAGAFNSALAGTGAAMAGPNIGAFMNPFTQQVTNTTLQGLDRSRQMATNDIGAQASMAGAFGGSRHGVADSLTNEAYGRQAADTLGNLNMQGFNTALGGAQHQQQVMMQGANQLGNLSNLGFGFGQQIGQQQAQQGGQQQGLIQSLIDAGRGQFAGYAGSPTQSLQARLAALGGANMGQQTQTTSQQPGLFNYLSMALGAL